MPKMLRHYPIYLAPKIRGVIKTNGNAEIYDEKMDEYLDPNSIDDKIKIYERQVKVWFLDCASKLLREENNGFIVLMIATSYIEGVQQYINGETSRRNSMNFFKQGLVRIFSLSVADQRLNDFYTEVRCGLFHNGMSGRQVIISDEFQQPIDFTEARTIKINPKFFLDELQKDFTNYISKLKEELNSTERNNFNRMFSVQ
jgi:hypothetical protein